MRKSIIVSIILFVAFQAKAQSFKTPTVINMSKTYMPFNTAEINFAKKMLEVGEFGRTTIHYTITKISDYTPSVKKYFADCEDAEGNRSTFQIEIIDKQIAKITLYDARNRVDWVMSK